MVSNQGYRPTKDGLLWNRFDTNVVILRVNCGETMVKP